MKAAASVRSRLDEEAREDVDACVAAVEAAAKEEKRRRRRRNGTVVSAVAVVMLAVAGYAVTITNEQAKTKRALVKVERKEREAREAAERASKAEKVADDKRKEAEMARGEQERSKQQFESDLADLEKEIADARGDAERLNRIAAKVAEKRGEAVTAPTPRPVGVRHVDSAVGDPP